METIGPYTFRPMDAAAAHQIATWRYPAPYELYSHDPDEIDETVRWLLTPDYHYYSVWDEGGDLIGFRCFGEDAQVPGGDYSADALDMGGGLRPDLTGRGLGASVMEAAFEFARRRFTPAAFRATVAAFNARALRVCERVGYRQVHRFEHPATGQPFIVLLREVG